jgi:hypothetical protein
MSWERHYYIGQGQIRDLNILISNLQQKVLELELKTHGRRPVDPIVREPVMPVANSSKEGTQLEIKHTGRRKAEAIIREQAITATTSQEDTQIVCTRHSRSLCRGFLIVIDYRTTKVKPSVPDPDSTTAFASIYTCAGQAEDTICKWD